MSQAYEAIPTFTPRPVRTSAEIQESKRLEKLQSHASSHRISGLHVPQKTVIDAGATKR